MPSLGKAERRLDGDARRVDLEIAGPVALGARLLRQRVELGLAVAHERLEAGSGVAGVVLERGDELRHHTAQVADQRHVDRAVDADRGGILLDVNPLADRVVFRPPARAAIVDRLAQLGAERDDEVGFLDHR